jgi:hypothetical protein
MKTIPLALLIIAMSRDDAARKAALQLGPSSNTYIKRYIIKERRFWPDRIVVEKCIAFDDQRGQLGMVQRYEICASTWEAAFVGIPLAQPIIGQ